MKRLLYLSLGFFLACVVVWAQASTAQIHGVVQDSSGAAVPGAEVKATQIETGVSRTVTSAADGGYVLTNLPIGPYRLEIVKDGFTKYAQSGIELQVNSDPLINPALKVGAVTEVLNVEANAALVETRSSGIGEVVQNQRIIELPLNGRNVTDLITLNGGAVQNGTSDTRLFSGRPYLSIGGMASLPIGGGATDWILDGASHYDFMSGTTLPLAFPDAVQEFKVETSGLAAARGNSSSVEVVTKSGTNDLHGDLFEFIRNDGFGSAHEYFSTKASTYKRHQFGGTVGGAIKKNKLFFFGGFQETTQRASPYNTIAFVPTQTMLNGDFSAFASAACGRTPLKGVLAGNKIDPTKLSVPAVYISNQILSTLATDGVVPNSCGQVTYNTPTYENDYQYVAKIDYQITDKHSIFFRDLWTKQAQPSFITLDKNLLLANGVGFNTPAYAFTLGDTYVINSNLVNAARIAFTRINETRPDNDFFNFCTAGVLNFWCGENTKQFGMLTVVNGFATGVNYSDPPPNGGGAYYRSANYIINDDANWVKGAHQIAFGGSAWQGRVTSRNNFASNGQFTFSGQTTGQGLSDFLVGTASQMVDGLPNGEWMQETFVNLYLTDTWKISPRLTVNAGVRWEPYLPISVPPGIIYNFDVGRFLNNVKSTQFLNAPPGFYYPGDPGFPGKSGEYNRWAQFAPRLGFAWDPTGSGKTSVRSSFSYGYAFLPGLTREDQQGSNPWGGRETVTNVNFSNPFGSAAANPFPYVVTPNVKFTPRGLFETTPYDTPVPSYSTWNFAVQRQIGSAWLVSATYMGSKVSHLLISVPINYAVFTPVNGAAPSAANSDARRLLGILNPTGAGGTGPTGFFGPTMQWNAGGDQHYNALLLSVQRRFSRNVSMNANWTHSHCIGQLLGYNTKADQTILDPTNINEKGNCDSDRPNVVNLTAVIETPKFASHALNLIASGWKWSGIYRFTSGPPLMIQDGTDAALSAINHQQPNLVLPGSVYTGQSGPGQFYFNKAAFAAQPAGTFTGNLGWNSLRGPTYWDMDMALSREFRITERQRVELRADAFNVTNSFVSLMAANTAFGTNFGAPPNGPAFSLISSAQFGQILGAQPTRKIQFALKYTF